MGFINPWLYSEAAGAALTDVVDGAASGCTGRNIRGSGTIKWASWNATAGWDPVTGLGTPNFQLLKALAFGEV